MLLVLASPYFLLPASAADVFTKDDLLSLSLKDGKLHRDGGPTRLMWAEGGASLIVSLSGRNGEPTTIFRMDPDTGKTEKTVEGSRPILSPDGCLLAYAAPDSTITVGTLSGGTFKQVATLQTRLEKEEKGNIRDIAFAPDANRLAYIRYSSQEQKDGQPWATARPPEIWVHDLDSGMAHRVFAPLLPPKAVGEFDVVNRQLSGLAYGADGRIYFGQGFGVRRNGRDTHIFYVDDGTAPVMLAEDIANAGSVRLRLSPDGRTLVSSYSPDPDFLNYSLMPGVAVFDAESGTHTLFDGFSWVGDFSWAPDGQVLIGCKVGAYSGDLCFGDVKTGEVNLITLERATNISSQSVSPGGQRVAWVSRDRTGTTRIRVSNIDGSDVKTLWQDSLVDLTGKRLGEISPVRWKSFDGLEIEGLLVLPVGYQPGTPIPMIVDIHGGAAGGLRLAGSLLNNTPLEHQLWAGKGYAVFVADYRKGVVAWYDLDAVRRHPGMSFHEADAADVIAGIQHLIDTGIADPARIAAIGHSYGAIVLNQLITQSDILALATSKEGTHDYRGLEALKGRDANPSQYDTMLYVLRATPETLSEWAEKSSPIVYADKIKTPLLLITAGNNTPDIIERQRKGADAFVDAINEAGGTAHSLFFADDFHVISKEKNVREMLDTTIEWIDRYIGEAANDEQVIPKAVDQ